MKKNILLFLALFCMLSLIGCAPWLSSAEGNKQQGLIAGKQQEPADTTAKENHTLNGTRDVHTYEELCELPANELLDLFIQNGLVISDELKQSFTEAEIQSLFKEHFALWHTGVSSMDHTMFIDLAEQTKIIYESIVK
ncbi:MAG: hypothetical protein Q4B99_04175 [Clostridia bacterium]|nr:hypothetical protein [Clostridia bacterium]